MKPIALLVFSTGAVLAGWWAGGGLLQPPAAAVADATAIDGVHSGQAPADTATERFRALALRLQSPLGAGGLKDSKAMPSFLTDLIKAQFQRADPAAFFTWQKTDSTSWHEYGYVNQLKELAKTDPEAAMQTALGMGSQGWYAAGQICLQCAATDPAKAKALWDALPVAARERADMDLTMATVTAGNATELKAHLTAKDWGWQTYQLANVCEAIWPKNSAILQEAAIQLPPGKMRTAMMSAVLDQMARTDPEAALRWCETHEPTDAARAMVALKMAEQQPAKAWELAQTLSGDTVNDVRQAAVKAFSQTNPARALELALGGAENNSRENPGRSSLFALLMARQPDETSAALAARFQTLALQCTERGIGATELAAAARTSLDEEGLKTWVELQQPEVAALLARQTARESPRQAVAWASAAMTQAPENKDALESMALAFSHWAGDEPASAAAAALTLPAGKAREAAVANTGVNWFFADPPAATAWLEAQSPGSGRDQAILSLASEMALGNPAATARLIAGLSSEDARAKFAKSPSLTPALKSALQSTLSGNPAWSAAQREVIFGSSKQN
jgi:hypothetical protein